MSRPASWSHQQLYRMWQNCVYTGTVQCTAVTLTLNVVVYGGQVINKIPPYILFLIGAIFEETIYFYEIPCALNN